MMSPLRNLNPRRLVYLLIMIVITATMFLIFYPTHSCEFEVRETYWITPDLSAFKVKPTWNSRRMDNLPNLDFIIWPTPPVAETPVGSYLSNGSRAPMPGPMEPVMSKEHREQLHRLLKIISDTMFNHSMGDRFMISYGTLLGSMRHHDFIPWDDDIDVLMDIKVRSKMRDALERLAPDYVLYTSEICDRFAAKSVIPPPNNSDVQSRQPVGELTWPFVDITFFKVSNKHIIDISNNNTWPISSIYPLYFRPFGKNWFPAPRDFLQVHNGEGTVCKKQSFSHALQTSIEYSNSSIDCNKLTNRYAFVRRRVCPGYNRHEVNADGMVMVEEQLSMMVQGHWKAYHSMCLPAVAYLMEYNEYLW